MFSHFDHLLGYVVNKMLALFVSLVASTQVRQPVLMSQRDAGGSR
jgi:hypothetical protein